MSVHKQEYKIEYDGSEVFFFDHSLKTAREHADASIERKKGKYEMRLYRVNEGIGDRWILIQTINKEGEMK